MINDKELNFASSGQDAIWNKWRQSRNLNKPNKIHRKIGASQQIEDHSVMDEFQKSTRSKCMSS